MKRIIMFIIAIVILLNLYGFAQLEDINCEYYTSIIMRSEILGVARNEPRKQLIEFYPYDDNYFRTNRTGSDCNYMFKKENALVLCSDEKICEYISQYSLGEIEEIKRYWWYSYINGFLVRIKTYDGNIFYMPIMRDGEKYGFFADKEIYTEEEFISICTNGSWVLRVNNSNIIGEAKVEYETVYIPLRKILETFKIDVKWEQEICSVIFGEYKIVMEKRGGDMYHGYLYVNDEPYGKPLGYPSVNFVMKEDVFYFFDNSVSSFSYFLNQEFGIKVEYDYEHCLVNILG